MARLLTSWRPGFGGQRDYMHEWIALIEDGAEKIE
jgi:hypothetical protein